MLENLAILSGITYLILIIKGIRSGWIFGIISAMIYAYLSFKTNLFLQGFLQIIYVFLGAWGFIHWAKEDRLVVRSLTLKQNMGVLLLGLFLSGTAYYLISFTDQESAVLDSLVTVFSIIATCLTAQKLIENWFYWWVINVLAMALYFGQGMENSAFLYLSYLLLSFYGYREWRMRLKKEHSHA